MRTACNYYGCACASNLNPTRMRIEVAYHHHNNTFLICFYFYLMTKFFSISKYLSLKRLIVDRESNPGPSITFSLMVLVWHKLGTYGLCLRPQPYVWKRTVCLPLWWLVWLVATFYIAWMLYLHGHPLQIHFYHQCTSNWFCNVIENGNEFLLEIYWICVARLARFRCWYYCLWGSWG